MSLQHDQGAFPGGSLQRGPGIAIGIADRRHPHGPEKRGPLALTGHFPSGGAWGGEKVEEKLFEDLFTAGKRHYRTGPQLLQAQLAEERHRLTWMTTSATGTITSLPRRISGEFDRVADVPVIEGGEEVIGVGDGFAVDLDDDVSQTDAAAVVSGGGIRPAFSAPLPGCNVDDEGAFAAQSAEDRVVRQGDAEDRTDDPAELDQLGDDAVHFVGGNGEADPGIGAGRAVDRGVHADEAAGAVEQGAAGVSRVDRGIGLDHALDRAAGDAFDFPAQAAR